MVFDNRFSQEPSL